MQAFRVSFERVGGSFFEVRTLRISMQSNVSRHADNHEAASYEMSNLEAAFSTESSVLCTSSKRMCGILLP
jgi:hypothetical protein